MTALGKWLNSVSKALPVYRRYIPIGLTLCTSVGLSVVGFVMVWNWESVQVQMELQQQADNLSTALQRSINPNLEGLKSVKSLYAVSGKVNRQEFKTFVRPVLSRHPAIRALNWFPRVSASERQAYEKAVAAEGFPGFQIYDRLPTGKPITAKQRQEYFPITYIESLGKVKDVLGLNVASDLGRKAVLDKSRDTGADIATGRFKLVTNKQIAFQMIVPIYRKGTIHDTLLTRRANLHGFLSGVFQINDIVKYSLTGLKLNNINFYLYDNSAPTSKRFLVFYESSTKQLIYDPKRAPVQADLGERLCQKRNACTRRFNVVNRQWMLLILPTPAYEGIAKHQLSYNILAVGLLWSASLAIYLLMSLGRTAKIEHLVQERTNELELALHNLQKTQAQLIQTEKMSSLGQMVAGVAHEINNPVSFVYGNLTYANQYTQDLLNLVSLYQQHDPNPAQEIQEQIAAIDLDFLIEDLPKILSSMKVGAERISQIVLTLRNFSRLDEAQMKQVDIHEGIDSTLLILQHLLKAHGKHPSIEVIKEYGTLPLVQCYAGQLNQVFMNILANAIDALNSYNTQRSPSEIQSNPSTIRIRTEMLGSDYVTVRIADNGSGMTEEVRGKLFDPFFTTKPVGKGTGLGLSISYQIVVEKHGGVLKCVSQPGQGAEFWIEIPVVQKHKS